MLMDIIQYLLSIIQYLYQQNCWLLNFICRYLPLKQWAFDDSHSPKYQKLKTDLLPLLTDFRQDWTYKELIPYFENVTVRKSVRSTAGPSVTFQRNAAAPAAVLPSSSYTKTTVPKARFSVRSAMPNFLRKIVVFPL